MKQILVSEELLRQVLDALREIAWSNDSKWQSDRAQGMTEPLRAALEQPAPVQEPVSWNQVQVCTWIGNQLMTQPSMFERNAVCKFVRSLGRNEKLAKYFPAPMAAQPRKAVKLSDSEIASDASRHWSEDGVDTIAFAHAIESAVWAKNG